MWWKYPIVEIGAELAQHLRHELQLVVLHPHGPALGGDGCRGLREAAVDPQYASHHSRLYRGLGDHVVVQRPDRVVREALVVELDVLGTQRDRNELGALELERLHVEVGLAGPADPRAVGARMTGSSAVTRPPGERRHARSPSGSGDAIDGKPVRDDDEVCLWHACSCRWVARLSRLPCLASRSCSAVKGARGERSR